MRGSCKKMYKSTQFLSIFFQMRTSSGVLSNETRLAGVRACWCEGEGVRLKELPSISTPLK